MNIIESLGINVPVLAAMLINLILLLLIFQWAVGERLQNFIENRREFLAKLKNAEATFQQKLAEAEQEASEIVNDAMTKREEILSDAKVSAKNRADEIVSSAEARAESIEQQAEARKNLLIAEIEENFVDGIKRIAGAMIKKLVGREDELRGKYLDSLVAEFEAAVQKSGENLADVVVKKRSDAEIERLVGLEGREGEQVYRRTLGADVEKLVD